MALTAAEEAQTRELLAQQAAILALAAEEPSIISSLGATDVSLSDLTAASSLGDSDLLLVRQGVTDKSIAGSVVKSSINALTQAQADVRYAHLAANNILTSGNTSQEKPFPATTGTVTLDLATGDAFGSQLTGNIILANPSNMVSGDSFMLRIQNDAATPRTIVYGSVWKAPGRSLPSLTATAGATDLFGCYVESTSRITIVAIQDSK